MVNAKEKDNGSTSILNPEIDSTKTTVTETAVSEAKTNLKETVVVSETKEKVEPTMEEAKTEENANENASKEEDNEANAEEEEDNGANAEEEEADEENDEEETNEGNSQEEEEEEEGEENNDDNPMEEDITEEKKEEEIKEGKAEPISKEEETKEEKAEPISKELVKKSRKRSRNNAVAAKDKDKPKLSVKRTPPKKAKTVPAKDKDGPTSAGNKTSSNKAKAVATKDEDGPASAGKKTPSKKAKTAAAKDEGGPELSGKKKPSSKDKPESSGKKKASKRAESMGMIFMCSSKTKKDCYRYKVLGLPASKKDTVEKIYKGMRLFLYDVDLKLMYGIYKAAAPGGFNIEPKAFNSAYPSQVRFTVLEECLPLAEEKFKKVIKENYYSRNKFDCLLNSDQVKNLCKLFASASKGTLKSKKAARSVRADPRPSSGCGRIRRRVPDEPRPRSPRGSRRYIDRPVVYEREAFVPPMAPMHSAPPLPAPHLPYAYDMDAYGRDPPLEHSGRPFLNYEPTRRDEIGGRDRYTYREREPLSYRDPVYSAGGPLEYNYAPPAEYNYVPPPALPSRYHYPAPASEYRSSAGVRADYHIPAEGRRTEYQSSARDRVYRL